MSDAPTAIAGSLAGYKTLADGALRLTVDLPLTEAGHFHALFPQIHMEVAIAPLRPAEMIDVKTEPNKYGEYAKALWLSGFLVQPEVWRAAGSDAVFQEYVRFQKCIARAPTPCAGQMQAAHVRRVSRGAGTSIKPPYSTVPLCWRHHDEQHNGGEGMIGGEQYIEEQLQKVLKQWVWDTIKHDIDVKSMRDAEPIAVLSWAQQRQLDRFLPVLYREAA